MLRQSLVVLALTFGVSGCSGAVILGNTDGGGDAAASGCMGTAPSCYGSAESLCCSHDPVGVAVCLEGAWMCGNAYAPGCSGAECSCDDAGVYPDATTVPTDAGVGDASPRLDAGRSPEDGGVLDAGWGYGPDGGGVDSGWGYGDAGGYGDGGIYPPDAGWGYGDAGTYPSDAGSGYGYDGGWGYGTDAGWVYGLDAGSYEPDSGWVYGVDAGVGYGPDGY